MVNPRRLLRLNVGFILHEEIGYSHSFSFAFERARLGDDLDLGGLNGELTIGRTAQGLILNGSFRAETRLTCVRCLKDFDKDLTWSFTELYAMNEKSVSESDLILPEDAHIDLEPLIREYAILEVPISPLHSKDCKGLCPVCGQDLNDLDCGHRPKDSTGPFAALKDFYT